MDLATVFSDFVAFWLLLAVPSCIVWMVLEESRAAFELAELEARRIERELNR